MPQNSQVHASLGSTPIAHAEEWRAGYHLALANAAVFLLLALIMFASRPVSLVVILSAPALFFLGSTLSFLMMVRSGGELAAVAWFVFGSGIYFGIGAVAGGLHVHPHSDYLFADDTFYLVRVNLLNACSVLIVLAAAYPLANRRGLKASLHDMPLADFERALQRVLPYIVAISAIGVGLKYVLFPVAESLLLRSMAAKIYLIIPSCFLLMGLLWRSIGWQLKLIAGSVFFLEILNGLIGLTKYQVISAMLAFAVGMWLTRRSVTSVLVTLAAVASVFVAINPLVTLGRAHIDYDADKNTIATRLAILADAVAAYYLVKDGIQEGASVRPDGASVSTEKFKRDSAEKFTHDVKGMTSSEARLRALGRRFDVASIQGYLVNEYNDGRPGNSLIDFWAVMVPRVLWPEKPIITRFGTELNIQFYYVPGKSLQTSSSTAPTYSAEAYWNYGPPGVVLISVLLGLGIGWFTRCWQLAMAGRDPAFFLIAFPVAIWASFVESWVVATYFGEFIIFVVILLLARTVIALFGSFTHRVLS